MKKRLVSGIKATGRLHVGNYFGAMRQFLDYQNEYESYIFVANYHALTTVKDAALLKEDTLNVVIDYLAVGLDPKKVTLYTQTQVPQVAELAWIFDCLTTMPYLMRAHAFKDAGAKSKEVNVGLFNYPMLMAADILLPDANVVPVGSDQKQHVEMARDTALKFNSTYGETFTIPQELIRTEVATVPGIDGRKMSKSYGNTIPLFTGDDEIKKLTMSIVTDSKSESEPKDPEKCNVFALHKLFSQDSLSELKERYVGGKIGYRESKEILAGNIIKFMAPLRAERARVEKDLNYVQGVLEEGGKRASEIATAKMELIRPKVGLI